MRAFLWLSIILLGLLALILLANKPAYGWTENFDSLPPGGVFFRPAITGGCYPVYVTDAGYCSPYHSLWVSPGQGITGGPMTFCWRQLDSTTWQIETAVTWLNMTGEPVLVDDVTSVPEPAAGLVLLAGVVRLSCRRRGMHGGDRKETMINIGEEDVRLGDSH